jgi:hypothetical protein
MRDMLIKSEKDWFLSKVEIADSLYSQYGYYGESDAEILLCCAISALASKMWSGKGFDNGRFTEFLIKFTPRAANIQRISVPVLAAKLRDKNLSAKANLILNNYLQNDFGQVFTCDEIDQTEDVILSICPNLESRVIRSASHVEIIYEDLRCGLVHNGHVSKFMFHDFSSDMKMPYYANLQDETHLEHPLCFPYNYIREILVAVAENAFAYRNTVSSWPIPRPSKWWIDGQ